MDSSYLIGVGSDGSNLGNRLPLEALPATGGSACGQAGLALKEGLSCSSEVKVQECLMQPRVSQRRSQVLA